MSEEETTQTSQVNFPKLEHEILSKWNSIDIYNKIQEKTKDYPPYVFLEGPPTANGRSHFGHVLTRVVKDVQLRFKTMKGFHVTPRVGGWDCHGLPVEIEIEKKLGLNSKEDIEAYGVAAFNQLCRESVLKYVDDWIQMSHRVGFMLDMNVDRSPPHGAYVTMTNDYIESVWWSLAELHKKGRLFKGYRIVPYCSRCATPLSSHELSLGYQETKDPSIFIAFNLKDSDRKLIAWTTTPWTLISNLLLAVKADADYAVVQLPDGDEVILAQALVSKVVPKAKLIETIKGQDLVGLEYESLFPYAAKVDGKKHFVTDADFVTLDDGSGIVHCAPAFGEDDYQLCMKLGVPLFNPVDLDGKFVSDIDAYAGMFVKDADQLIIADLKKAGKLLKKTTIEHTYPFCWRCDTPLLYYANDSWFIGMSKLRQELVANNEQVRWKPDHLKHGRFGNFIDEAKDWSLSRSRYWGTPLPIWICSSCNHEFAIGSVADLKKYAVKSSIPQDLDLHKPYIDDIKINCPQCKKRAVREPYVIDTWYDSGSAFFAQWHYPFENKESFDKSFPVDFITEAIDQTRGWFYTLLAVSTSVFEQPSYLTCLTMGHILAEDGSKMSKSRGNAISPSDAFENFGADPIRFYLCNSPVWKSTRFGENLVRESVRNFGLLLWNIYSFFETYTKLDGWLFDSKKIIPLNKRPELDQYAISALHTLISDVDSSYENLEVHKVTSAIQYYLDSVVSNWWIRRSRRRFWDKEDSEHESAYQTLFEIIEKIILLLAPVTPFVTDFIYDKVILKSKPDNPVSIHLLEFPVSDESIIKKTLEKDMNTIQSAVSAGRTVRANINLKNRQPLLSATLVVPDPTLRVELERYKTILEEELNVKSIELVSNAGELQSFELLPNFATIGPKFRKESKAVIKAIEGISGDELSTIVALIHNNDTRDVSIGSFSLSTDDLRVKIVTKEGFESHEFTGGFILLNVDLSDQSLVNEGISRDVIRRIQSMRKDLSLDYDASITLTFYSASPVLISAIDEFKELVQNETLTTDIKYSKATKVPKAATKWEITSAKGEKIEFKLKIDSK